MISSEPTDCDTVGETEKMNGSKDIPQSMDVILGRGKSYSKHPGNMLFQGKR
jgi:hypothetical protein